MIRATVNLRMLGGKTFGGETATQARTMWSEREAVDCVVGINL